MKYNCYICKEEFERAPSQISNPKTCCCSKECYNKRLPEINSGQENPNYKNGNWCKESYCECGNKKDCRAIKCSKCSKRGYSRGEKPFRKGLSNFIPKSILIEAVSNSRSYLEVAVKIGHTRSTVTKHIKKHGIDISHFKSARGRFSGKEILRRNGKKHHAVIKQLLLREKLVDYVCGICGIEPTWNGKHLTLELHHINGINNDNRIENLMFLCPNCHAQTDTNKGKNNNAATKKV